MLPLVLALLAIQDLGDEVKDDLAGSAIQLPAKWTIVLRDPGVLLKAKPPEGGLSGGVLTWERWDFMEPMSFERMVNPVLEWLKKNQEGHEVVKREDLTVGGLKAQTITSKWKETFAWRTVIRRSPTDIGVLEVMCAAAAEKEGAALVAKMLGTVRFYEPAEDKTLPALAEAAAKILKGSKVPAARLGTAHFLFAVDGVVISKLRHTVREAKVEGAAGYEVESLSTMSNPNGVKQVDAVKASFVLDGSYQKAELERQLDSKDGKRTWKAVAVIAKGKCTIVRSGDGGEAETVALEVGPATYLDIVCDESRAALAAAGKAMAAQRIVSPITKNRVRGEILEIAEPEKMRIRGAEARLVRVVLSQLDGDRQRSFVYEDDGRLATYRFPAVHGESRSCTKEEYEKAKLPGE